MKIALIDDHALILDSLELLILKGVSGSEVSVFNSAQSILDIYTPSLFDIIITDIEMPNISGSELVVKIREENPDQKILVLSMHINTVLLQNLFELNINGFVCKVNSTNELIEAINIVNNNEQYISEEIKKILIKSDNKNELILTKRELQIVQYVVKSMNNNEIAESMFISVHTVKTHRKNILHKLNMKTSIELVKYALSNNIV